VRLGPCNFWQVVRGSRSSTFSVLDVRHDGISEAANLGTHHEGTDHSYYYCPWGFLKHYWPDWKTLSGKTVEVWGVVVVEEEEAGLMLPILALMAWGFRGSSQGVRGILIRRLNAWVYCERPAAIEKINVRFDRVCVDGGCWGSGLPSWRTWYGWHHVTKWHLTRPASLKRNLVQCWIKSNISCKWTMIFLYVFER